MNYKKLLLAILGLMFLMMGCKSQEVPGRRRAPRRCNSCTKWSYVPQEVLNPAASLNHEA